MINKLQKKKIHNFEIIEGVDGMKLEQTPELEMLFSGNNFNNRKGVIGCALSHLELWNRLANDSTHNYYVILEDDIELCSNFKERLEKHCQLFELYNVEHLSLGINIENTQMQKELANEKIKIFKKDVYKFWNIGWAYIISKKACKKIIDFVNHCSIKCASDNPRLYGDMLVHYHTTQCIVNHPEISLVGSETNEQSKFDFNITNNTNSNIKISYCDWWTEEYCGGYFDFNNNFITHILNAYGITNINVVSPENNPDIIFYSIFGSEHMKYNNVRKIFYSGEPFGTRLNANYNITFDKTSDINFRYPLWLSYTNSYLLEECNRRKNGIVSIPKRNKFCSFISNGEYKTTCRREIVEKLSKYKRVDCGGNFLNNIGYCVPRGTDCSGKIEHNLNYKFVIAFENEDYPGYVTEKICDVYKSNCIPIYWGNKEVLKDFNPNTFIYAGNFNNFDDLVEYIIKVDNDEQLYASYFAEPFFSNKWMDIFNDPYKTFYKNLADCIIGKNVNIYNKFYEITINPISKLNIYNIWHNKLFDKCYDELDEYSLNKIVMYDVNSSYTKCYNTNKKYNIIREYELDNYDELLQKTNYCQTSCLYHIFINKLYEKLDYIGFIQYDMILYKNFIYDIEDKINKNKTNKDVYFYSLCVANKIEVSYICKPYENSILEKYNMHFNTSHSYGSIKDLSNNFICLHTFVIPIKTFVKMMTWYCSIHSWLNNNYLNNLYPESISEITEEVFGLFLLLQMIEDDTIILEKLNLYHEWPNLHNQTEFNNYKVPMQNVINNDQNVKMTNTINISTDFKIYYGTDINKIDITNKIIRNDNIIHIPSGDENRAILFGDPSYGNLKKIFIQSNNDNYVIEHNDDIYINIEDKLFGINHIPITPKYNLSILAIFKNETMNLKLWIEHYLSQGVEHFYLIDNGSTDNPFKILEEYINNGIITYYYRPEKFQQSQHYRYVFDKENIQNNTKWLCICDLDEFFFGINDLLINTLNDFEDYDVIYTNSHFYGSDNLIEHPSDIRTAIIHREDDISNGTKYIFKPSAINNSLEIWIHWLVESGTLQRKKMNEVWQTDKIRLNHYRIQSYEYFTKVKMIRGDVSVESNENIRDLKYFQHYTEISNIKDDLLKQIIENGYKYSNSSTNNINNTALIVEPRFLKHLPFVINDIRKKLGVGWIVVFYCGKGLKNIWIDLLHEDIEIRELNYNCYHYNEYCDFMKSNTLWSSLYGDYVLLFTSNSIIINEEPYTINFFMQLNKSYIGANQTYLWKELIRENIYPEYRNFQGGLSLRKRIDMIKIIDTFGSEKTIEDCSQSQSILTDAEDVYFAIGCYKLGLPVGDDEVCSHFSCHTILKDKFFGANRLEEGYYLNLIQTYKSICDNIYLIKDANDINNETLTIHPGGGFFSNCTVRLFDIILYFNSVKKLPLYIDGSKQFNLYKHGTNLSDLTYEYFFHNLTDNINYSNKIDFYEQYQYIDYSKLNFNHLSPFVKKYFTPSSNIQDIITYIENKYEITDYDNICVLFLRGNDKVIEIELPSYETYIKQAKLLQNENKNIKYLIQSDELDFIEQMFNEFSNNSFYFKDEIRTISKNITKAIGHEERHKNFEYAKIYLAITIIMSKCKYIICSSGNCSLWLTLFRGHSNNIYQFNYTN